MKDYLIWVIGKDQYTEGLIYYLKQNDNVLIQTTNIEYVDDTVRILAPCDMKELKADVIVLPYSNNISIGKFGRISLSEDFFVNQKDALFFSSDISYYSKIFASRKGIKIYSLLNDDKVKEIKKIAIVDLIIHSVIDKSNIILQQTDFGILIDKNLTPTIIDIFKNMNLSFMVSDKFENLLDQNVIIIPSEIELNREFIDKYKSYPFLVINLYEDDLSFNLIKNGKVLKLYSLRLTNYALHSYAFAFSNVIIKQLKNTTQ